MISYSSLRIIRNTHELPAQKKIQQENQLQLILLKNTQNNYLYIQAS